MLMAAELGSGPWRHCANTVPPLSALTCRIVWHDIIASQQLLPMETSMTVSRAGLCNAWASGTMTQCVCEFRLGYRFCQGYVWFSWFTTYADIHSHFSVLVQKHTLCKYPNSTSSVKDCFVWKTSVVYKYLINLFFLPKKFLIHFKSK